MWQKFGEYQLNRFRHTQQNLLEEAGGFCFPPTQILISLNVQIRTLQLLQPTLPPLHLSQPWYLQSLKVGFATFCYLCNLHNTNRFKCFHNITQMRPLILTCHGHLFKTWKSDLQLLHPFQTLQPWYTNPKNWEGGQNGISSSIGYFKMRMKLEKKVNNDVIVISMLWPHHHFDVWPQLKSRRFWGFWLNISKWRNWFSPNVSHFLDNYPQPALKVKDRSIFDGREEKWYFSYDFECVTEFSGKDFKLPHIPNFTLIHRKTAKTWSHFSWCGDTSKMTIMTSYHQIEDDVIKFFSNLKRFITSLYSYQVSPSSDLKYLTIRRKP